MRKKNFKKIKDTTGIYVNQNTGTYYAEKIIKGTLFTKSFETLENAKRWHVYLKGANVEDVHLINETSCSTLKAFWQNMQTYHFPLLATSTKEVWIRRYKLLERLENLPMDQIAPSKITEWVQYWVKQFGSDVYQENG